MVLRGDNLSKAGVKQRRATQFEPATMFIVSQPRAQSVTPDHNYRPRRVGLLLLDPLFCKQFQVNRIAHDLATLIRRVQMIAAIGGHRKKRRAFWRARSPPPKNTN